MPAISYKEFSGGLDRRIAIGVQDANRLWTLKNAYITSGKKIAKRPGLRLLNASLAGSVGLEAINGALTVFTNTGSGFVPPTGVTAVSLTPYNPGGDPFARLVDVLYAQPFQGFLYVVAQYSGVYPPSTQPGLVTRHHYVDGSPSTLITDSNCPHSGSVTKAASRIFAVGGEVVRYCAAGAARDWTTSSDAGFLPASLQQDTRSDCTAVGTFSDSLVVLFPDAGQIWDVQVDPSANQLRSVLGGVGTIHPLSLASFYRDLVFASPFGARSMSVQESVERIDETDVGVPVDSLVQPAQDYHEGFSVTPVLGIWIQQLGQYWLMYRGPTPDETRVFAYSYSRTAKLACWSEYTFPIPIMGVCTLAGKVYVRSVSSLYELAADQYTDGGAPIPVDVQMAYQDAKLPGVEKMFYGADYVFSGTARVSYLYDPRDQAKETTPQDITGDTRAGTLVPVEVTAAAIAPRFQHEADEAFSLDLATLYFHTLGLTS